jgi:hypothetical protein
MVVSCRSSKHEDVLFDLKDPEFLEYKERIAANYGIALNLAMYDIVAWISTDSVSNRLSQNQYLTSELGAEWFVYQDKEANYHAVFGKYYQNNDRYNPVFHFILNNQFQVVASDSPVDSQICLYYARAINRSLPIVYKYFEEKKLKLNWYVLGDSSGRLNVWYLPGQLTDEYEVYGMDFHYIFDATGKQLVDSVWNDNGFKMIKPSVQKQVTLMNFYNKYPTVDNIFCALSVLRKYKKNLSIVYIVSQKYTSALAFNKNDGYSWVSTNLTEQKKK